MIDRRPKTEELNQKSNFVSRTAGRKEGRKDRIFRNHGFVDPNLALNIFSYLMICARNDPPSPPTSLKMQN